MKSTPGYVAATGLPCSVIVQDLGNVGIKVGAIDPQRIGDALRWPRAEFWPLGASLRAMSGLPWILAEGAP